MTAVRRYSSLAASLAILFSVATACGSSSSDSTTTIAVSGTVAGVGNLPAQDLASETDSANQSSFPPGSRSLTVGELSNGPRLLMIGDSIFAGVSRRYGNMACERLVPLGWQVAVEAERAAVVAAGDALVAKRAAATTAGNVLNTHGTAALARGAHADTKRNRAQA